MRWILGLLLICGIYPALAQDATPPEGPPAFEFHLRGDKGVDVVVQSEALKDLLPDDALAAATVLVRRKAEGKEETLPAKSGTPCKIAKLKIGDELEFRAGETILRAVATEAPERRRFLVVEEQVLGEMRCARLILVNSADPDHAARMSLSVASNLSGVDATAGSGAAGDHPKKNPVKGGLSPRDDARLNGKKVVDLLRKPKRFLQTADDVCAIFILKAEDLGVK